MDWRDRVQAEINIILWFMVFWYLTILFYIQNCAKVPSNHTNHALVRELREQPVYQKGPIFGEMIKDLSMHPDHASVLSAIIRSPVNHYAERNVIEKTWTYNQQYSWLHHMYIIVNSYADGKADNLMERLSDIEIDCSVPIASYYLLVDDYCFVNTPYLLSVIKQLPTERFILCAPRVSGQPFAVTPNACNMTLPVLVSGDVVMDVQQLKKTQANHFTADLSSLIYYGKHLYLSTAATELFVRGYYTEGRPMNFFFSAPLFSLNSTIPIPEMIARLWMYAENDKLAI